MKKILRESFAFLFIVLVVGIICFAVGGVVCVLWSTDAGVAVSLFGTILMLAVLGAFD